MINIQIASIERDTSIQCRATIDTGTVNEYADAMRNGDEFPPIVLFGSKEKSWIGDGWHRLMAADQCGKKVIWADLKEGGRLEALKHALGANSLHGRKRTNEDKRRCVEIALKEFPKLSSRTIAEMCGVTHTMVNTMRPIQLEESSSSKRMSADGRERPAHPNGSSKKECQAEEDRQDIEDAERILADPDDKVIPSNLNGQLGILFMQEQKREMMT